MQRPGSDGCILLRKDIANVLTRNQSADALILNFPATRTEKNKYLLFEPAGLWYFVIVAWLTQKTNFNLNSIKKNKVIRNKFSKISPRYIQWKLLNTSEKIKDLKSGKIFHVYWLEDSVVLRWQFSTNWTIDLMNTYQNPNRIFLQKLIYNFKIHMEMQKNTNSQNSFEKKKNRIRILSLLDFKIYCETTMWHKNRHIVQWKKIDSPEINNYIHGQSTSEKVTKAIQWKK